MPDPNTRSAKPYDLFDERGVITLLCALIALAAYFLVDTFVLQPFQPLSRMPWAGFVLAAGAGALAAWVLARAAPVRERASLVLLCAAALGAAAYPGMLRINAWTSPEGGLLVDYKAVVGGYQSQDGHSPHFTLDRRHAVLAAGLTVFSGRHDFTLWHGALGFDQLDLGALRADYDAENTAAE